MEQLEAYSAPEHRMPRQKPGRSVQTYGTPRILLDACEYRWDNLVIDLAASDENHKANYWFTQEQDSLRQDWTALSEQHRYDSGEMPVCWLNPPFSDIRVWAQKCWEESQRGCRILLLTPASVGSQWYADCVDGKALVCALNPRVTFEGCTTCYPKDCLISAYGFGKVGFEVWRWKDGV